MTIRFSPSLIPSIAAAVVVATTLWAAQWQYFKGVQKERVAIAQTQSNQMGVFDLTSANEITLNDVNRKAIASGQWLVDKTIFLDNRSEGTRTGHHILIPLMLTNKTVLVNMGWFPRAGNYPAMPTIDAESLPKSVSGTLVPAKTRYVELGKTEPQGTLWQNLDTKKYVSISQLDILPVILSSDQPVSLRTIASSVSSSATLLLTPVTLTKRLDANQHFGYSVQWAALALLTLLLWIGLNIKRTKLKVLQSQDEQTPSKH